MERRTGSLRSATLGIGFAFLQLLSQLRTADRCDRVCLSSLHLKDWGKKDCNVEASLSFIMRPYPREQKVSCLGGGLINRGLFDRVNPQHPHEKARHCGQCCNVSAGGIDGWSLELSGPPSLPGELQVPANISPK